MRVAVGLPSLDKGAPQRRSIDAMLAQLVEAGHDIEGFAEHDRVDDAATFRTFHYLRLGERHECRSFDTALYPLGRDATPYQSVLVSMSALPGMVWFLDPVVHHLAIGGVALLDDWAGYRLLLDDAYPATAGAIAQTVASNWGTGALFRRYDLIAGLTAAQRHVVAAWPALAARVSSRLEGRSVPVVPLANLAPGRTTGDADGVRRVAIMTVNDSYATSAVRAAAAAIDAVDGVSVKICLSEPIYKAEGLDVARHLEIDERIDWELTTAPERLAVVAEESHVLVWLAEELQGGHRLLLLEGMAAGKVTLVPRCALYDDIPDGAVAKVDLGRPLGATCGAILGALRDDADLRRSLITNGRAFALESAGLEAATRRLAGELERSAKEPPQQEAVSAPVWNKTHDHMMAAAVPGGASPETVQIVDDLLRASAGNVER